MPTGVFNILAHKLDIFETLAALDTRQFDFLDNKPEDVRKGFAPVVVLRWMSAITPDGEISDAMLVQVNEAVNHGFFDIADHPDLQYRLLASCGFGQRFRHQWIPVAKQKKGGSSLFDFLSTYWPEANKTELNILLAQFTRESFHQFVYGCGLDPVETKGILNAYDGFFGIETSTKKAASASRAKGRTGKG